MTAPSKVSRASHAGVSPARTRKPRKFPVSDGAPVEVV
ncbi:MAG TPA: esterase, partial [Mycobacterium sp.]|nr:esterase [Mycobacterium sp.]